MFCICLLFSFCFVVYIQLDTKYVIAGNGTNGKSQYSSVPVVPSMVLVGQIGPTCTINCLIEQLVQRPLSGRNIVKQIATVANCHQDVVFRTLSEMDYQCLVEIVTEPWANIILVIKFPTSLQINCNSNKDTITVMKKNRCLRLCDLIADRNQLSPYFVAAVNGKIRFWFLSNSSINSDLNANMYQVTATSARPEPPTGCNMANETNCVVNNDPFCLTTGVVCDGINNCGVQDWFDERKSDCGLTVEKLGFAPVIAVMAAIFCALLAAGHTMLRCLPPLANSFFIFNANEDNRLCIDPVYKSPGTRAQSIERAKQTSLIPVSLTSSSNSSQDNEESQIIAQTLQSLSISGDPSTSPDLESRIEQSERSASEAPRMKATMRSMAKRIQNKFRKEKNLASRIVHL